MRSLPFLLVLVSPALADVSLPALFSDHAVLQRARAVPVWGRAEPGEAVTVQVAGQTAATVADANGRWRVDLDLSQSGPGPNELVVEGKNRLAVSDILIGEVWLASGQSNMEWRLRDTTGAAEEIANSANANLRQFVVTKMASPEPLDDVMGEWRVASPDTSGDFSAVAYYFSKALQKELQVPVGVINSTWGGTPSEAWTSPESLKQVPDLAERARIVVEDAAKFPQRKEEFAGKLEAWVRANGREDRRTADVAEFAGPDALAEDWKPVQIPGDLQAAGLPSSGVIWLKKEVVDPPSGPLTFDVDGFETVYWNGQALSETSIGEYPGPGQARPGVQLPEVRPGKNVLAIRIYAPSFPAKFRGEPKIGSQSLKGEWLAKAERELAPADGAPVPPPTPLAAQNLAGFLFNGMIAPLVPYAIQGVIWYQGEANVKRALQYRTAFPLLINDWRRRWAREDLPFYFCQLASYQAKKPEPSESAWAELREAQSRTLSLPSTGQAVLIDIGESGDIHPRNKKDAGERLSRIALAKNYAKAVPYSGPVLSGSRVDGKEVVLTFDHADGGLVARELPATYDVKTVSGETAPLTRNSLQSPLEGFAICGEDRVWHWADARIDGRSVIVSSPAVRMPLAVRYAWADHPTANLFNGAGLPASPFRTDDFPLMTRDAKY